MLCSKGFGNMVSTRIVGSFEMYGRDFSLSAQKEAMPVPP